MAFQEIRKPTPENAPCGVCRAPLPQTTIVSAFAFDGLHELPEEARTGRLNLVVCETCNYAGHIWDGFVAIDRLNQRIVYIDYRLEPVSTMLSRFNAVWDSCLTEFEGIDQIDVPNRRVLLENFSHLLPVLTVSETDFQLEANDSADFAIRAEIPDYISRAKRLVEQLAQKTSIRFQLRGDEKRIEFQRELLNHSKNVVRDTEPGQSIHKVCKTLIESIGDIEAPVEYQDYHKGASKLLADTEWKTVDVANPSDDLSSSIKNMAANPSYRTDGLSLEEADTAANILNAINRLGSRNSTNTQNKSSKDEVSAKLLNSLTKEDLLSQVIHAEGKIKTAKETIVAAYNTGSPQELDVVLKIILSSIGNNDRNLEIINSAVEYFENISNRFESLEAALSIMIMGGQYFEHTIENKTLSEDIYAAGLNIFCRALHHSAGAPLFSSFFLPLAIGWESMGYRFSLRGQFDPSIQSFRIAKSLFSEIGHKKGAIKSSVGELGALKLIGRLDESHLSEFETRFQDELELDLTKIDEHDQTIVGDLFNFALISGSLRLRRGIEKSVFLCGIKNEFVSDAIVNAEKVMIIADGQLFDNGERQYSLARMFRKPLFSPNVEENKPIVPDQLFAHNLYGEPIGKPPEDATGIVEYFLSSTEGSPPYVSVVNFSGCLWLNNFILALDIAHASSNNESWLKAWISVIEEFEVLSDIGVQQYLCRCVEILGPTRGLSEEEIFPISLLAVVGRLRQYKVYGTNPLSSSYVRATVDKLKALVAVDPVGFISRQKGAGVENLLGLLAEVFEAVGHFERAYELHMMLSDHLLDTLDQRFEGYLGDPKLEKLVTPAYRAARTLNRDAEIREARGRELFELGELCKVISLGQSKPTDTSASVDSGICGSDRARCLLPANHQDTIRNSPKATAFVHFTLLHETDLNSGFWQRVTLLSGTDNELIVDQISFKKMHGAVSKFNSAFEQLSNSIFGKFRAEVGSTINKNSADFDVALDELSDALVPASISEWLSEGKLQRVVFVPEAYLFDVPFPALKVEFRGEKISLGLAVSPSGPVPISVVPSVGTLKSLGSRKRNKELAKNRQPFVAVAATTIPWNSRLSKIRGVEKRLRAAVERFSSFEASKWPTSDNVSVQRILEELNQSETFLFFGHGLVTSTGSAIVATDGLVGGPEIKALRTSGGIHTRLAILLSCSGINSSPKKLGREVHGIHVELLNAGTDCVVGCSQPLTPSAAVFAMECLSASAKTDTSVEDAMAHVRQEFSRSEWLSHPVFWGFLQCYGNGLTALNTE
ncbi:CHAT domain-containing protein [Tropicibacter sp. R15_0]|uniref:CHAT domain-containing protein n=1 Tax=Tropicibacter sp. R15_0 TaxID=2821101 RepID=UPI001AD9BBE9|nr:CHAT domain-containing protein [Tropicibacter sp. R15_0]MBO9468455.1 CHAT domain-containing protein [Tropicibacter sp. R15_0]